MHFIATTAYSVLGVAFFAYQMLSTQIMLQGTIPHFNTHLGFALLAVFLGSALRSSKKKGKFLWLALAVLSLIPYFYIQKSWQELQMRAYFNIAPDLFVGTLLIIIVLVATAKELGLFLPVLIGIVIGYPFIGHLLPEPFYCHSLGLGRTVTKLSIGLESGIFQFLNISSNYIFLFVVFGALLQQLGGTKFFFFVGERISALIRGGPAMMAVVSSAVVGSITGSGAANVLITGTFTIPMMKKAGYTPEQAAAIEAAASNGGQVMPPVMGMVAFGMAGLTGIAYSKICAMSILPALLYFFCVGMYVYCVSGVMGITREKSSQSVLATNSHRLVDIAKSALWFILPFTIIVALLLRGYSVMFVAFWANVLVILLAVLERKKAGTIVSAIVEGVRLASAICASVAAVGMMATTFAYTGIGVKIASAIGHWSGGNLMVALIIIWAICILLGCVGLSLTAYIIVAIFAVEPLVRMGIPYEVANFFVMYAAIFSYLTPPVAVTTLIASKVANARYLVAAVESVKAVLVAFLLPFLCVYCPSLLHFRMSDSWQLIEVFTVFGAIFLAQASISGFLFNRFKLPQRVLAAVGAASLMVSVFTDSIPLLLLGTVCGFGVVFSDIFLSTD